MTATEVRLALIRHGYTPIPLYGKGPPEYGKNNQRGGLAGWSKLTDVTPAMIAMWARTWTGASNTGALTHNMPAFDIDVFNEDAAIAIEELARERFEERGWFLVRIGLPPKRAIVFRTITPFRKITAKLTARNGSEEKLELLGDGQQLVVDGIHPDTRQPYRWHGGEPWRIRRDELPYLHEHEAQALINDAATLLNNAFGYTGTVAAPKGNDGIAPGNGGEAVWKFHLDNIRAGRSLHDSITQLAAVLIRSGMQSGAAVHLLAALLELSEASHDERWEARYRYIPRAIDSAYAKYSKR